MPPLSGSCHEDEAIGWSCSVVVSPYHTVTHTGANSMEREHFAPWPRPGDNWILDVFFLSFKSWIPLSHWIPMKPLIALWLRCYIASIRTCTPYINTNAVKFRNLRPPLCSGEAFQCCSSHKCQCYRFLHRLCASACEVFSKSESQIKFGYKQTEMVFKQFSTVNRLMSCSTK